MPTGLELRIALVAEAVAAAAERSGRSPESVTVVAVTKTVGRDVVEAAYRAGVRHFGENRVQDAMRKFAAPLPDDATLHMIGQLQSNKAAAATRLFDLVESVDRESLISELEKQATKQGKTLPVLLQVNVAREAQKAGCDPDQAEGLARSIQQSPHLHLRGLMTIAPLVGEPEAARPVFKGLRELRDHIRAALPALPLETLSMGMSNDYWVAIEEGATLVRIGRAIFDDR